MRFVDEASLFVKAGDGGRGWVSFRRAKYVPRGGPDGGDGGKGGDVLMVGRRRLISLLDFRYKRNYKAESGKAGGAANRTGRNGADLKIEVPLGTEVRGEDGLLLADIVSDGQTYVVAAGGRGGRGNTHFATPSHRVPTEFQEGEKGQELSLTLQLKLLAAIGIVGLPNAGKSTLLSKLTDATPEVADYPFTTLTPALGVFMEGDRQVVLADIPGIIEGASRGKGLGLTFLRHIERTRMLLWVIDVASPEVMGDYGVLLREITMYDEKLSRKGRIVVLNKTDLVSKKALADLKRALRAAGETVMAVSALSGAGIDELKGKIGELEAHG